jgi:FkbM family methyltransferase
MSIFEYRLIRKLFFPVLKFFNPGEVSIKHHYTKSKITLDAFSHRIYWYLGKHYEQDAMMILEKLIKPGNNVIEVGGHIGYTTNFLSHLLSNRGHVFVFEPGHNNLPYIKTNIRNLKNVTLIEKAISDSNGTADFYIEVKTGVNNSLLHESFNGKGINKTTYGKRNGNVVQVETTSLDTFCEEYSLIPDFIKIEIQGAELFGINGMKRILKEYTPILMIEVTRNWEAIYSTLNQEGYLMFTTTKKILNIKSSHKGHIFCLHRNKHKHIMEQLMLVYG